MEELWKITEGFRKAEKVCRELANTYGLTHSADFYDGEAEAYQEVVGVLEDFMTRFSVYCVKAWEAQETWEKGVQRLAEDIKKERSS